MHGILLLVSIYNIVHLLIQEENCIATQSNADNI